MCKKATGCIWQLLTMGQKAAKLPNYCILHWRLNALKMCSILHKKVGYLLLYAFPRSREGIKDRFLLDKNAIDTESTPSPFEVGILPLLPILLG